MQVVGNGAVADELDGDGEPAVFGGRGCDGVASDFGFAVYVDEAVDPLAGQEGERLTIESEGERLHGGRNVLYVRYPYWVSSFGSLPALRTRAGLGARRGDVP